MRVEWIIISLSHREPSAYSLLPQTPKQHSGPLESTLGLDDLCLWHRVTGKRIWLPSKDNICQSSLVSNLYCLSAAFTILASEIWFQIQPLVSSGKPFFMFLITLKNVQRIQCVFLIRQLHWVPKKREFIFHLHHMVQIFFFQFESLTWRVSTLYVSPVERKDVSNLDWRTIMGHAEIINISLSLKLSEAEWKLFTGSHCDSGLDKFASPSV